MLSDSWAICECRWAASAGAFIPADAAKREGWKMGVVCIWSRPCPAPLSHSLCLCVRGANVVCLCVCARMIISWFSYSETRNHAGRCRSRVEWNISASKWRRYCVSAATDKKCRTSHLEFYSPVDLANLIITHRADTWYWSIMTGPRVLLVLMDTIGCVRRVPPVNIFYTKMKLLFLLARTKSEEPKRGCRQLLQIIFKVYATLKLKNEQGLCYTNRHNKISSIFWLQCWDFWKFVKIKYSS